MKNVPDHFLKKSLRVLLPALFVVAYSCKKDNNKPTGEQLIGKWSLVSAKWNDHYNDIHHYDSTSYDAGLFTLEFKSNGTAIASTTLSAIRDTATFTMLNDQKLVFDGVDTFTIQLISNTDLQLYFREGPEPGGSYYEEWDHYKKQ